MSDQTLKSDLDLDQKLADLNMIAKFICEYKVNAQQTILIGLPKNSDRELSPVIFRTPRELGSHIEKLIDQYSAAQVKLIQRQREQRIQEELRKKETEELKKRELELKKRQEGLEIKEFRYYLQNGDQAKPMKIADVLENVKIALPCKSGVKLMPFSHEIFNNLPRNGYFCTFDYATGMLTKVLFAFREEIRNNGEIDLVVSRD
jgi:RNase H-fold protein (predicted Holliday junction resolvase)